MVGYNRNDILTPHEKLVAGCTSGCMTRFITQPLDVVKLRTQLKTQGKHEKTMSPYKMASQIFQEEGLKAFWAGHNLGQFHSVLSVSTQFYVYEITTKYFFNAFPDVNHHHKNLKSLVCGTISGCCGAFILNPLEVIRVRQIIVKQQYGGLINGARKVYQSGGILAFYEGVWAAVAQMGPQVGISFAVFSFVQRKMLETLKGRLHGEHQHQHAANNVHSPQHLLISSTVAGSAAGIMSKSLTYPFDLAKRRLQIGSHVEEAQYTTPSTSKNLLRCKKLSECLVDAFQKEGLRGLYRGWRVTIFKAQMTSVVAFTTYELMCYAIREVES